MEIRGLGLIISIRDLQRIRQSRARKPFTVDLKAIYDPSDLGDYELAKELEGYFGIQISRTLEDFIGVRELELILNLYNQDKGLSIDLHKLIPEKVLIIEGKAAEIIWENMIEIEQLSIQREIFFQALNSTIEGIQIADAQGIEIFVNNAFLEITHLTPGDRLGRSVFDVSPDGGLAHVIKNKQPVKHIRNHPKGTDVELLSNAAPIIINGSFYGAVSVMQDITEVLHLSQELNKSQQTVTYLNKKVGTLAAAKYTFADIIGDSELMQQAIAIARKAASGDLATLIQGETGTGKEIFAHAIHNASNRRTGPFIPVNCAAIPEQLLESEFFGHEKGSFTGANSRKLGMFELAHNGTLFLDEIGDMDLNLQSKLLRVLQEKEFLRVGGTTPIKVNARIIAATNRDLLQLVREGKFREDLFYRLNVINITIPPLRDRLEDLPQLVDFLIKKINKRVGKHIKGLSQEALRILRVYRWPGNVRELENILERAIMLSQSEIIQAQDIHLLQTNSQPVISEETEKEKIKKYLIKYGCSVEGKKEAARHLNMSLATLYSKIKLYQLDNFYVRTPKP